MRLKVLYKTSGFRLAILFLSTFGLASICLCGFLYFEVRRSTIASLNRGVARETLRLNHLSDEELIARARIVEGFEQSDRQIALFREDRTRIAGANLDFPKSHELSKPFRVNGSSQEGARDLFCFATPHASGSILLVCRSSRELWLIQQVFKKVILLGVAAILIIGISAAVVLGVTSLRQIQSITASIQSIMAGDFRERLSTGDLSGDLAQLAGSVNEMLSHLERLMHELKNSSENIAHDLRTPLTRVLAKLERGLRNAESVGELKDLVSEVVDEIKKIVYRFSAILRISELEDRLRRSEFKVVDLVEIVGDALEFYEPLAAEKGVSLLLSKPERPVLVFGDRSLLFEAISNLLDNAVKYTTKNNRIDVVLSADPIRLEIRDFGPGIENLDLNEIKERYKRHMIKDKLPGFGIGLSIVDSIARLHNFEFRLEPALPGCRALMTFKRV